VPVGSLLPIPIKMLIMKIASTNIRGLKTILKQRMLKRRITQEKVDIVMIQETQIYAETMKRVA